LFDTNISPLHYNGKFVPQIPHVASEKPFRERKESFFFFLWCDVRHYRLEPIESKLVCVARAIPGQKVGIGGRLRRCFDRVMEFGLLRVRARVSRLSFANGSLALVTVRCANLLVRRLLLGSAQFLFENRPYLRATQFPLEERSREDVGLRRFCI